jgi:membrane protein
LISIMLSIGVVVLLILALVLVVFGPAIGRALANQIGASSAFRWAWTILQWPLLLAFVLLAFSLVYRFAPDVEQQFRLVSPGAVAAIGLWLLFSLLFSLYVNTTTSYNRAYDALVGVAVFMLYLYYSAFILLVGAEVNQIIKEHAPDGKEKGEKVPKRHDGKGQDANQALHLVRETRPHQPEITGSRPFSQAPMGRAGDRRPV